MLIIVRGISKTLLKIKVYVILREKKRGNNKQREPTDKENNTCHLL